MTRLDHTDTAPVALSIRSLSKSFGATRALRDVTFDVIRGHIHGLRAVTDQGSRR